MKDYKEGLEPGQDADPDMVGTLVGDAEKTCKDGRRGGKGSFAVEDCMFKCRDACGENAFDLIKFAQSFG